jgi:transcriptional regulator with AAA-type ATPase domain
MFVISRPALRNFITPAMFELTEPKSIDCLFSLQTTVSGRLINEAIPTNEEPLLSLKLALMHAVLTNQSYWIDGHDQDCNDIIELINKASAKPLLHTIMVTSDSNSDAILLELFGIDSIATGMQRVPALLQKLDKIGVLYIKNIDYLSLIAQEKVARFIETGQIEQRYIFNPTWYDIRLFCSGSAPLAELLRAGRLHKKLQEVIEGTKIFIPSVSNISVKAADEFIKETAKRFLTQEGTNIVLTLNTHEREKIRKGQSIFTLCDLRKETRKFLEAKSKHIFGHTDTIAPIETFSSDQLILHAANLGKQALHDRKTMAALWLRLKSQQRIAEVLRVNRSTVWRALKKFDIKQDVL